MGDQRMGIRLGDQARGFTAETTAGTIDFCQCKTGHWPSEEATGPPRDLTEPFGHTGLPASIVGCATSGPLPGMHDAS